MDYLKNLKGEALVSISADFDYLSATANFVGLKLMPMVKTENMKVAMYNLLAGQDIPVIALVHALDSEARIADRPDYEEIKAELFLIKAKLNQGEELRKKIKDMGMSTEERAIVNAIYDDIANLISRVLTGFERRACELLSTGKIVIDENGAKKTVNFHLSANNSIAVSGWATPSHDILADIVAVRKASGNKIVRAIVSGKVMGYIMANEKLNAFATNANEYVTAKNFLLNKFGVEFIVDDRTYKTDYVGGKEYRFFDEDTIIWLTTRGVIGKTFMTSTPTEDANETDAKYGFVAVDAWMEDHDPHITWSMAEGIGLPVIADINNTLYLSKVTA